MQLKEWIEQLRILHDKYKQNKLAPDELEAYEGGREQLARALLKAQQLTLKPGETARQALRVARALQVDLELPTGWFRGPTVDLSSGGFSLLLSAGEVPRESIRYKLRLGGDALEGRALPVQSKPQSGQLVRVSFAFENMKDEQRAKVETAVFDVALKMLDV